MFNRNRIDSWNDVYEKQKELLRSDARQKRTLTKANFIDWHNSEIFGEIRADRSTGYNGPSIGLQGFLPSFLMSGYLGLTTKRHALLGGADRNITLIPAEMPEAAIALRERLLESQGLMPAVPATKAFRDTMWDLCFRPIIFGELFGSPHRASTESLIRNFLGANEERQLLEKGPSSTNLVLLRP